MSSKKDMSLIEDIRVMSVRADIRHMMGLLLRGLEQRPGAGQVLNHVPERLVDGDVRPGAAARDPARQDFADLSDDVLIADEARFLGSQEFGALAQHALAAVGDEARSDHEIVVHFDGPLEDAVYDVHVSSRPHPGAVQDGLAGGGDRANDVGIVDRVFYGVRAAECNAEFGLHTAAELGSLLR